MSFWNSFRSSGKEKPSPQDWIPEPNIVYRETLGRLEIDLTRLNVRLDKPPRVWMPYVPDTNSMDAVFDLGNNNIYIAGADEVDQKKLVNYLKVGDIAVYRFPADTSQPTTAFVTHRIVEIGKDSKGKYFRFKGDNNSSKDFYLVREDNIKWVSIGVIY